MFGWFKRDYTMPTLPDPITYPPMPQTSKPKNNEHYRVGFDDGTEMVTLTLLGGGGTSMTLSMNKDATEHLIRMLRAAIPEGLETEEE